MQSLKSNDDLIKLQELTDELAEHCYNYYVLDNPTIDDAVYDKMYDELLALESKCGIVLNNSPTHKVQGEVVDGLQKVKHTRPMLSCAKTKDYGEVKKFCAEADEYGLLASLKLDGLTLCLTYENCKLKQAVTRGNGVEGEDVTHNARMIKNLPQRIPYGGLLEIRGECLIRYSDFKRVNKDGTFANPRNLAAGSIRQLDSNIAKQRELSFFAFDIIQPTIFLATKAERLIWLEDLGFQTVISKVCKDYTEVFSFLAEVGGNIYAYNMPIDGCVVEYNGVAFAASLGETAHHERRHLAFKFTDEVCEAIFRGVELNTGRNGIASITAIFDPVEIDGSIVSRASLHNVDIFNRLKLGIGDTITVYKANQIIPQVQENLAKSGTYKLPDKCPICGATLEVRKNVNTNVLYCPNDNCQSKLLQKLVLFVSKDGMNIEGLAEAQLAVFVDKGWIKDFSDIYELFQHGKEMEQLDGFGELSVAKLLDAIDHSRRTDLAHIITALGIPGIGKTSAKDIAQHFGWDFKQFFSALMSSYDFTCIDGIGATTDEAIYEWWSDDGHRIWLGYLGNAIERDHTFILETPEQPVQSNSIFSGKSFCITGTFDMGSRPGIVAQIEKLGGKSVGSVSKKTDFLLAGRDCGSKLQKAKECGVRIIEEAELKEILNENQ